MPIRILVALDDTPGAQAARDLAVALARRTGAGLTAAVVLDRPHTSSAHEFVPAGGGAFKAWRDAALTARAEQEAQDALAALAAAAGDVPFAALRLEDAPEPALLAASAAQDLVVIGLDSSLGRELPEDGVAPVIEDLLKDGTRPLLVVPPGAPPEIAGPVVAAHDGSAPSRQALRGFARLKLGGGSPVHVVAVAGTRAEAERLAAEGAACLEPGGPAAPRPVVGDDAARLVLAEVAALGARLLVMGAFGGNPLLRMVVGSTTHTLLRDAGVPVFVQR
ncbi:universal stress protein [Falsiroseomonas sp. CW058]|uniref:universal stress protein n=1 Tax=Falsiroseomonas sp. CW058 TaxID=3388664 RepID=UPI003D315BD1